MNSSKRALSYVLPDAAQRNITQMAQFEYFEYLPQGIQMKILAITVIEELKQQKLAKAGWKDVAETIIAKLRTVCSSWDELLACNYFKNVLCKEIELTAIRPFSLQYIMRCSSKGIICGIATTEEKLFALYQDPVSVVIYRFVENCTVELEKRVVCRQLQMIRSPVKIVASHDSLYVSDRLYNCIWRIDMTDYRVERWMESVHLPWLISVSNNGNLIVPTYDTYFDIYRPDATLIRRVHLPTEVKRAISVIHNRNGNFICSTWSGLYEITSDGRLVKRSTDERTAYNLGFDLQLDSFGRFLWNEGSEDIMVVDSQLNWYDCKLVQLGYQYPNFYDVHMISDAKKRVIIVGCGRIFTIFRLID